MMLLLIVQAREYYNRLFMFLFLKIHQKSRENQIQVHVSVKRSLK